MSTYELKSKLENIYSSKIATNKEEGLVLTKASKAIVIDGFADISSVTKDVNPIKADD